MNTAQTFATRLRPPTDGARCEHGWATESAHRTSEGVVRYTRCVRCGSRRVELLEPGALAAEATSRVVGDPSAERATRIPGAAHTRH